MCIRKTYLAHDKWLEKNVTKICQIHVNKTIKLQ